MTSSTPTSNLTRRLTGIAALFGCALVVDPARVINQTTAFEQINLDVALHALILPALAAVGLWLVLPNVMVLAICVLMLAVAHSQPGAADLFAGYLYPALAVGAAFVLLRELFRKTGQES